MRKWESLIKLYKDATTSNKWDKLSQSESSENYNPTKKKKWETTK